VNSIADRARVASPQPQHTRIHHTWSGPAAPYMQAAPTTYMQDTAPSMPLSTTLQAPYSPAVSSVIHPSPYVAAAAPGPSYGLGQGAGQAWGQPHGNALQGDLAAIDAARRMRARLDELMGGAGDVGQPSPAMAGSGYPPSSVNSPAANPYWQQDPWQQQQQQQQHMQMQMQQQQQMQLQTELQRQQQQQHFMQQQQQLLASQQPPTMTTMTGVQTTDALGDLTHVHAGFAAPQTPSSRATELPRAKSRHDKELKKNAGDDLLQSAFKSAMMGTAPSPSATMEGRRTLQTRCVI
jgi:hypothetical protein